MKEKMCLICKKRKIMHWESACKHCWEKLTPKQQRYMVVLNKMREILRECGIDFEDLGELW